MSAARQAHAARPVDASMGLLNEVIAQPLDPGYAQAAADRREPRGRVRRWGLRTGHLLVAVALGLATAGAIVSLRAPESSVQQTRTLLAAEIAERAATAQTLADQNEVLSAEVAQLQSDALESANPELFARLAEAELLSGAVAVQGPGLVIELADAPVLEPDDVDPASRVQDLDLQVLTNGLWAAGAEAIAINGQRLTSLSAIRSAGQAILVDLAPLVGPYRVEAIGDVRQMQTAFARTSAANHIALLTGTYDIAVTTRAAQDLTLPGSGTTTLRYAAVPDPGVASSEPAGKEGAP
ncbi:MAG TPA: DUF881 domain-containing protein [Actinotalea sp.]|nr:DUF881 domain-containing protein [Actinotalea sp.]